MQNPRDKPIKARFLRSKLTENINFWRRLTQTLFDLSIFKFYDLVFVITINFNTFFSGTQ